MALIKCSECGKEISDKAEMCVNCGNPIQKEIEKQKMKSKKSYDELTKEEKKKVNRERFKNQPFDIVLIFILFFVILLCLFLPPYIVLPITIPIIIFELIYVKSLNKKYYEEKMFFDKTHKKKDVKNNKTSIQNWLLFILIFCIIVLVITIFNNFDTIIADIKTYMSDLTTDKNGFLIPKKSKISVLIHIIYLLTKNICLLLPCISFLGYCLFNGKNKIVKKVSDIMVGIHILIFSLYLIFFHITNFANSMCILFYNSCSINKNIYFIIYNIIIIIIEIFSIKKLNKSCDFK